ncbi:DEHA2D18172p [Debaryomyces hansenii CBS767]|uniref:DEHA2D18172p n=1 Tax=Debaryomyces hansenii (strain ATCC 36239 / CBS 767 / BCRC 21394 / JCM 1990 / NBRC 0083 / IGC 2968) TaxID=284592 RepID=B5RTL3_DEBHA|nr:DEHA2D18172p [Debaryomyces hansenii CBS767]CAR65698.1 DEHA2D18172p [Debaryomyces hansenii CBS767]|eukprot:XP_002770344.1 DEHA2D18172p [Debaryomyces hansenii CBS767]
MNMAYILAVCEYSVPHFSQFRISRTKKNHDSISQFDLDETINITHMSHMCLETCFSFACIMSLCLPILSEDHPGNSTLETAKYVQLSPEHHNKDYILTSYTPTKTLLYIQKLAINNTSEERIIRVLLHKYLVIMSDYTYLYLISISSRLHSYLMSFKDLPILFYPQFLPIL